MGAQPEADVRCIKAKDDSIACAAADAECRAAMDEIEHLTAAMFAAPVVSNADAVALAVAGFVGADVMARSVSSAELHTMYDNRARVAFARLGAWVAETAAVPLGQFADTGTIKLMRAA